MAAKYWTNSSAHEPLGKSVKKRQRGRAEQDKRGHDQHEKNVLNHVHGEGGVIKSRKRRTDGKPEEEHPREESSEATSGEEAGRRVAKREPAAKIAICGEKDGCVQRNGWRPFVEKSLRFGWHDLFGLA